MNKKAYEKPSFTRIDKDGAAESIYFSQCTHILYI